MTVSEGPQWIVDPEASLRVELTGAIAAAQADIANAIAELTRSGADSSALTAQTQTLQQLQRIVATANLGSLFSLRGEVAATATNATNLAQQAVSTAANSSPVLGHMTPAERARANIEALHHDLFEKHVLDPYLQFNSAEEEEAYRKREAERDEARKRALALNSPEGDRRAAKLALDQLQDAGAHGADRSPDFLRMVERGEAAMGDLTPPSAERSPSKGRTPPVHSGAGPVANDGLEDILATLKAAGVTSPAIQTCDTGHGVSLAAARARDSISAARQG